MSAHQVKLADFRGRSEGLQLEFKASAALEDPVTLPRAVCSFLNSRGGNIVVGLRDDGLTPDPIADTSTAKRRLEDLLASTIAPSLPHRVSVEIATDAAALVIKVPQSAANGQLFAVRSTQGRFLVPTRVGARTLPLEWAEIAARIQKSAPDPTTRQRQALLEEAITAWADTVENKSPSLLNSGAIHLILRSVTEDADAAVEPWKKVDVELRRALIDPSVVDCQRGQAGFSDLRGDVEKTLTRKAGVSEIVYRSGSVADGFRILEIQESPLRELRFATQLDGHFVWGRTFDAKRESSLLQPYAISQTVVSCCRLFAHLLNHVGEQPARILAALDLRGLAGRRLPPGPPAPGWGYSVAPGWPRVVGDPGPIVPASFDGDEFLDKPDLLARRLLELLYMRSGWSATDVPFFDAIRNRFVYS